MDNLSLIAAIGKNNELGADNQLLWHLKKDMKFFKEITTNHPIIMGRKCFESLNGLLPNRKHIILTNNKDYKVDGALVFNQVNDILNYVKETKEECFIIGGAKIYELFLPYCKRLYLTEINDSKKADCYFPSFNTELYKKEVLLEDNEDISFKIIKYTKK